MASDLIFGDIEICIDERQVRLAGQAQALGSRAFDVLVYLAEHRDRVVTKSELLEHVWQGLMVEDNNLSVQVSSLRKLLGAECVKTAQGRGYQFTLRPDVAVSASAALPSLVLDRPSIAVLPFLLLAGSDTQSYLPDAVTEDITTELSRYRLFVISRNSSFTYKGRSVDVKQVSRELGVRYVVEGSVRISASQLRVTAQLIDATQDTHVWAERYDGSPDDLFDIQDQAVRSICAAVAQGVDRQEFQSLRRRPASADAYALATRADQLSYEAFHRADLAMRDRAVAMAREALVLDPQSGKAHAALALAHWQNLFLATAADREVTYGYAMEAAEQMLALDAADAMGHNYKGLLLHEKGRHAEALACIRLAHHLNPNDVRVLGALGLSEIFNDLPASAAEHLALALRISPLDPWAWSPMALLSLAYFALGDYVPALEHARAASALAPATVASHVNEANACVGLGDLAGAAQAVRRALEVGPEFVRGRLDGSKLGFVSESLRERYRSALRQALAQLPPDTLPHWARPDSGPQV